MVGGRGSSNRLVEFADQVGQCSININPTRADCGFSGGKSAIRSCYISIDNSLRVKDRPLVIRLPSVNNSYLQLARCALVFQPNGGQSPHHYGVPQMLRGDALLRVASQALHRYMLQCQTGESKTILSVKQHTLQPRL